MGFKYSDRCIAVVEILEVEAAVAEHGNDATWFAPIDALLKEVRTDLESKRAFLRMSKHSNWICLSAAGTDESFLTICFQVCGIGSGLLKLGYPIRGGIAVGAVYHDDSDVFGPAYLRAKELATEVAKYPRVIFDPQIPITEATKTVPRDADGIRYVDILAFEHLHDYWAGHPSYAFAEKLPCANLASDIQRMKETVKLRLNATSDPRAKEQYEWLERFLNLKRNTGVQDQ